VLVYPETYLTIAVDNYLDVMYFDGTLVPGSERPSDQWSKPSVFALPANVTVIALQATNAELYYNAGILASDTFGNILTYSNWKCTPIAAVNSSEWMMLSYSDASWPPAVTNGANVPSTSPWGQDTNISADAQWIWTTSQPTRDQFIYCRLTISEIIVLLMSLCLDHLSCSIEKNVDCSIVHNCNNYGNKQ